MTISQIVGVPLFFFVPRLILKEECSIPTLMSTPHYLTRLGWGRLDYGLMTDKESARS
jgi:hypothetical protein